MKYQIKPKSKLTKKTVSNSVKTYVKKVIAKSIEDKYIDTTLIGAIPSWAYGFLYPVGLPTPGTGRSNRIGDKIRPVKIEVQLKYYGSNTHSCRVIFFRWHPQTTPTGGNVLDGAHASSALAILAPYDDQYSSMYTVLKDNTYTLSANGSNQIVSKFRIGRKKLAGCEFVGTTAVASQQIYYLLVQDGSATLNSVDAHVRMYYEDA